MSSTEEQEARIYMDEVESGRWDHMASLRTAESMESMIDDEGTTECMQAALEWSLQDFIEKFKPKDFNRQRMDGKTVVHCVCQREDKNPDILKFLIEQGANTDVVDSTNKTALHCAFEHQFAEAVNILLDTGCSLKTATPQNDTVLHIACVHGTSVEIIHKLHEKGCDVNSKNASGTSPLMFAAQYGYATIVNLLKDKGADTSMQDNDGKNAVHYCCNGIHDNGDIVYLLYDHFNIMQQDCMDRTPLAYAIQNGKLNLVKALISCGEPHIQYSTIDKDGWSPMHFLSRSPEDSCLEIAKVLIKAGFNMDAKDLRGCTPLMCCASYGHYPLINFFIEAGASREGTTSIYRLSALHLAAYSDRDSADTINVLLDGGFNVDARSRNGMTPLMAASWTGNMLMVKALISRNAEVSLVDSIQQYNALHYFCNVQGEGKFKNGSILIIDLLVLAGCPINSCSSGGRTPLALAALHGQPQILNALIRKGAKVDHFWPSKNVFHWTPLMEVCNLEKITNGHLEVICILVKNGAQVNKTDRKYNTPLIRAVLRGHQDIAKILVQKGADVLYKDDLGKTALHYACCAEGSDKTIIDIVRLLVMRGKDAVVNSKDCNGWTPLMQAAHKNNIEIVKYFIEYGACLDLLDNHKRNIMHIACSGKMDAVEIVSKIVSVNIAMCQLKFNAQSNDQEKPIDLALNKGHLLSANILATNYGCDEKAAARIEHDSFCYCLQNGLDKLVSVVPKDRLSKFVKTKTSSGRFPVHLVANISQLHFLKKHGADPNKLSEEGQSLLHYKVMDIDINRGPLLEKLLAYPSINCDKKNQLGQTPLHVACNLSKDSLSSNEIEKHKEAKTLYVKQLLSKGANINQLDDNSVSPLNVALESENDPVIYILDVHSARAYKQNGTWYRAIHHFVNHNRWKNLDNIADVYAKDSKGRSALHYFAKMKNAEENQNYISFLNELINRNLNVNHTDQNNDTPMKYAIMKKNYVIAKLLSEQNGCIIEANGQSYTLLQHIMKSITDKKGVLEKIRENVSKDNVDQTNSKGDTILHYLSNLKKVTTYNFSISRSDAECRRFCLDCAEYCLKCGADPNIPNLNGKTSIKLALKSNFIEMVTLMVRYGGRIEQNDLLSASQEMEDQLTFIPVMDKLLDYVCANRECQDVLQYLPETVMDKDKRREIHQELSTVVTKIYNCLSDKNCAVASRRQVMVLKRNHTILCDMMEPDFITDKFYEKGIIGELKKEEIQNLVSRRSKVFSVLDVARRNCPYSLPLMIEALCESQKHLAAMLQKDLEVFPMKNTVC